MGKFIIRGKMIYLGNAKWVRSDLIVAVESTKNIKGYYYDYENRARVLISHPEKELIASRTARTILRDMGRKDVFEWGDRIKNPLLAAEVRKAWQKTTNDEVSASGHISDIKEKAPDSSEKEILINYLMENDTVQSAIKASPWGQTKFYKLVKKFGLITSVFLNRNRLEEVTK